MYKQKNGTDPVESVSAVLPKKARYKKVRGQSNAVIVRQGRLSDERKKALMKNAAIRDREFEERRSEELKSRSGSRYADKAAAAVPETGAEAVVAESKRSITLPAPLLRLWNALAGLNRKNAAMIAACAGDRLCGRGRFLYFPFL